MDRKPVLYCDEPYIHPVIYTGYTTNHQNPILYFDPNIEQWTPITYISVPDIEPGYYISSKGRVYSTQLNRFLKITPGEDYCVCSVRLSNGKRRTINIHRTLMMEFNYVPGCEYMLVNHIDTNKLHNEISNYEWTTYAGNAQHASKHGLLLTGEDAPWTTLKDEQVHQICRLYIEGYSMADIARIVGCKENRVFDVIHKVTRTDISDQYDIVLRQKNKFTEEQIHFICKTFVKYKGYKRDIPYEIISEELGIDISDNATRRALNRMYTKEKKTYYHITQQYDY